MENLYGVETCQRPARRESAVPAFGARTVRGATIDDPDGHL